MTTSAKNPSRVRFGNVRIAEDSQGILVETLLEGMAEYYSAELSEKVIRGQTENALKGKCTGGTGSIGYKIDEDKFYHLDPLLTDGSAEPSVFSCSDCIFSVFS